ncbi:MAG: hypothetical protein C0618_09340 [Desulfuromonas sp.]|nr:MAG: hypothetical protein C0618_09340 [Desulfuromonas sp.]
MMTHVRFFSSLRFKFALLIALFSGGLMLFSMFMLEKDIHQSMVTESLNKGIGIARAVAFNAEDPLLTGDDLYLFSSVNNALKAPGIVYAIIADDRGIIKAADDMTRTGQPFTLPTSASLNKIWQDYRVMRFPLGDLTILDLSVPIFSVADPTLHLGDIHLGLSEQIINDAVNKMRQQVIWLTLAALIIGSLFAYLLASFFVRPVDALVEGVRAIGRGNLDQQIDLKRKDEFGLLTGSFNEMAASLREKEFIKTTFERYVSTPVAKDILSNKESIKLGGEEKDVTVIFTDIRGFTSLAENLPAGKLLELLNTYFERMIQVIIRNDGMVDKFIGDSVMALFGAPLARDNDPLRAVKCALEMCEELEKLNQENIDRGEPPFEMGIGINTGPVVAGNIGSSLRMEYTVIGDNVNIAARLQGIASAGEVLMSEQTHRLVADKVQCQELEPVQLKGKNKPVGVYRITGISE